MPSRRKWITAIEYQRGPFPDDMDDAYVELPGRTLLSAVWDVGCELDADGKVVLYGAFDDAHVSPNTPIYYT